MLKNYLLIARRRILQNKLSSLIKLTSLFIGMISFILIAVYVYYEFSFDRFNKQANNIVRATTELSVNGKSEQWSMNGTKTGPELQRTFPAIKSYTRIIRNQKTVKFNNTVFNEKKVLFVDSDFLRIFTFPLLEGKESTALDGPGKIVITRSIAKKYFGNDDPLGKNLVIDGDRNYMVTGITSDPPKNSQIQFDFLVSFSNLDYGKAETWFPANFYTYLLLEKGTDLASLNKKVDAYVRDIGKKDRDFTDVDYFTVHLEPLTHVHLHSNIDGLIPNTPFIYIYILIIIALLILTIAIINYANITIAQVTEKRTEIGIRKLLGAKKGQLFMQFIGESAIFSVAALVLSVVCAAVLLPYFSILTEKDFPVKMLFHPAITGTIIGVSVLVSLISGAYPAIMVSGHSLNNILKPGFLIAASGGKFRRTLIVVQFIISIVLIITTLVIREQRSYIQTINLGFDKSRVISLPTGYHDWSHYENLKAALKKDPYVKEVTSAYTTPVHIQWTSTLSAATETGEKQFSTRAIPVDIDFLKTLSINVIAGSDFNESDLQKVIALENTNDIKYNFIVNETAVKQIGWTPEESIGRQISIGAQGIVKAVVKDFHISSLHETVQPLVIFLSRQYQNVILVKINGQDMSAGLSSIKKVWNGQMTERPFDYHFLDEEYDDMYKNEQRTAAIFSTFSTIAILLACLGLFGIVSIMTVQRTKETGIRKIMGASAYDIIIQFFIDYLRPILIAFIAAIPIGWYSSYRWLSSFAYHINIELSIFIISGLFSLTIAMVTIIFRSVKVANSNPVNSLRNE